MSETRVGRELASFERSSERSGAFPCRPLILIVDDSDDNREMCAEYLERSGFRVAEATSGIDALAKMGEKAGDMVVPDLVVMDLSMPEMDGWEAIRKLKADRATRDIPVIVLTGYGLAGHGQAANAGCAAYLVKPCLPEDLVGVLRAVLETRAIDCPVAR